MANEFLLPCQCGHNIKVVSTQAGQMVTCDACGLEFEAPSMIKIRQLNPVDEKDAKPRKSEWSFKQGMFFTIGATLVIIFGVGSGFLFYQSYLDDWVVPVITDDNVKPFNDEIDNKSGSELLLMWQEIRVRNKPGDWKEPEYVQKRRSSRNYFIAGIITSAFTALGACLAIFAVYAKPKE